MALKFNFYFHCRECGIEFGARRSTAVYCGGTCAKRAERKRKPKPSDGLTPSQRAYNTKCDKLVERRCLGCRTKFFVNGNNSQKKFHSSQCMRKAKRFKKSLVDEWLLSP